MTTVLMLSVMQIIPVFFFLNESSFRRPSRLVNLTIICTLALRDLSAFIYFIPSILSIHSAVTPVEHSAIINFRIRSISLAYSFFSLFPVWSPHLWPIESLVLCVPLISSSFLFPGTCLFLHLRYTPLWGKKKSNDKTLLSEAVWSYSMW